MPYLPPLPHPRGVKDRIQAIDNLNVVFAVLKNEGIRPVNISEVDITDGNVKLTLGLLWLVFLLHVIHDLAASYVCLRTVMLQFHVDLRHP